MPKPFDATLKDLGREYPRGFITLFDGPTTQPLTLLNVDLSTVTVAADFIIGLGEPLAEILHIDFQSSAAAYKHFDILVYQSLLLARYHVPVHSMVILLRPQAAHSNMDGTIRYTIRPGRGKMEFGYEVMPLWQQPAELLLAGDLGIVPLAPLGELPARLPLEEGMADVIQRVIERVVQEATPEQAAKLLAATFVLSGLRLEPEVARQLFRGARAMRESTTYMAIIDEGRETEVKRLIFLQGEDRFGPADEASRARINAMTDLDRLEALARRLLNVASWSELLQLP
jgi:hypothetical protein